MKKNKKFLINKIENEKGAITAIVLASLLIITVVFINIYMIGSNKSNSQEKEIKMIQQAYNYADDEIDSKYKSSVVFENVNVADTNPKEAMPSNIKEIVENDANKGIVIKDKNENEWVWVEVPQTTVFTGLTIDTTKELTDQNYTDIKNKLITYVGVYRNGSASQNRSDWKDEWYAKDGETLVTASTENLTQQQKALKNGCGLTYDEYKEKYQKMLKSVYLYGGFWIGRYEAGIEGSIEDVSKARTSHTDVQIGTSPRAISQKDAIPYNYVSCSEAQTLAKEMAPDSNCTSSLMFGIQWDLVCKFLEVKSELAIADINSDSSSWGNYNNIPIIITSENAKKQGIPWIPLTELTSCALVTTGASEKTKKMNIHDFAGNEWEWTLEHATSSSDGPCTNRGGYYYCSGSKFPVSHRSYDGTTNNYDGVGFRTTFYSN